MNVVYYCCSLVFILVICSTSTTNNNEFVVLLISQPHIYILSQIHQASTLIPKHIPLIYTHTYASSISNWYAIYPIFASILDRYSQMKYLFIGEYRTRFHPEQLLAFIEHEHNRSNAIYMSHGLYDKHPSIIHHYSLNLTNPYPDLSTGMVISRSILMKFIEHWQTFTKPTDFMIDIKYELNQLINQLTRTTLNDRSDRFCYEQRQDCLTWYDRSIEYACERQDIQLEHLYFAIKTYVGYHQTRVNLLRKTWLTSQLNYHLFTNAINETIDKRHERFILTPVNTQRGHCHKTFFILKFFLDKQLNFNYLILADDDTLLSVQRILRVIRCFLLSHDSPFVLGERYAYGEHYDYPTGGSGIIFNRQAVEQIIENCHCPTDDTPDDMFLGLCLKRLQIPLIHIPELHQAQPDAYAQDWLVNQKSISFHKFEGIDVEHVYRTYLHEDMPVTSRTLHQRINDEF
jgi:UDP-glucose:O-linked fucose beta-1,3-glucosyltransferase